MASINYYRWYLAILVFVLLVSGACGGGGVGENIDPEPAVGNELPVPSSTPARDAESTPISDRPDNWVYWLSDIDIEAISMAAPPVAVIDYSRDGDGEGAFSSKEIQRLRTAMPEPALVISYLSIGEAEDYRYYWDDGWETGRPTWLDSANPDWAGNFKVRYWDPDWQAIVFGSESAYLDRILAAGFDGVYLDIIDAYEFFAGKGREAAEDEMVEFVTALGGDARERHPGFLIIPQNAPELGLRSDYLSAVDGVGMEGIYFGYESQDERTDPAITEELEEVLSTWTGAGKLVLSVDYAVTPGYVADAFERAADKGFTPTVTDVELEGLPIPRR